MARFNKVQVICAMKETGMVPVFYNSDINICKNILDNKVRNLIFNTDIRKICIKRVLDECKSGRQLYTTIKSYLNKNEQVDHIDNDKTHDTLENLQILTPRENIIKSSSKTLHDFICGWCDTAFQLESRQMHKSRKLPPCCSRSCSAKLQSYASSYH